MTETGVVLSMFSALAVLAVGVILGAGVWARARRSNERAELAVSGMNERSGAPHWLIYDDDRR